MRRSNFLSGLELDRAARIRSDPEKLDEMWRLSDTRVLPVWRSKHIVVQGHLPQIVFLAPAKLESHRDGRVLLGTREGAAYFTVDVSHLEEPIAAFGLDPTHAFLGLRDVAPLVSQGEGALLAYASGILSWHRRNRFCGVCGGETRPTQGGHIRACAKDGCKELSFPRTDPAVIMLVTAGEECLLGRQASWSEGVYSTLAGFVEPGESLEEAVKREVLEETGIELDTVQYHSSQPWPFPSSLMLGFTARARSRAIRLETEEIEDARWFTREQVRIRDGMKLPSEISIARRLIEDWLSE
ncbi:MAG: NAD(+) diphosphatase [Vicinamibacteria bacterium]